jgi:integrase
MKATITIFAQRVGKQRSADDLGPDDFQDFREHVRKKGISPKHSGGLGPDGLTRTVTIVRGMFKYAYEMELIDRPMKYGRSFERPSATQRRKARRASEMKHGKRLFSPAQIRQILALAGCPLRAMILLGLNAGFGNTDCSRLVKSVLDLKLGIIEFDRPKTGIERVAPIWPETIQALQEAIEARPSPREEARDLVFVTKYGRSWSREIINRDSEGLVKTVSRSDSIGQEFDKLLRKLEIKRPGLSFYALRHTFRTLADEAGDQHAVHRIMGHQIPGMSGIYVEEISLDRLRAVTDHVRSKIFA